MSCVVAGLRYYFRIYKYEYLGELMTSELHIARSKELNLNFSRLFVVTTFLEKKHVIFSVNSWNLVTKFHFLSRMGLRPILD